MSFDKWTWIRTSLSHIAEILDQQAACLNMKILLLNINIYIRFLFTRSLHIGDQVIFQTYSFGLFIFGTNFIIKRKHI